MISSFKPQPAWPRYQPGLLSVVIPCFNEGVVLPLLRARLGASLDALRMPWEVIFIDDGSSDDTLAQLAAMNAADPRFKVLSFSRNFGHQTSVAAGLAHSAGEVAAVLDADLQDPPELLAECLRFWREGDQVVYCVRRRRREGFVKRFLYLAFYRVLRTLSDVPIPFDSGDFCVMDRRVVDVVLSMPERHPFMRGMRAWAGFRQRALPYDRPARAAGETKYPLLKLFRLAADGIFSFTLIPLRLATWTGLVTAALCVFWSLFVLAWRVLDFPFMGWTAHQLPGWTAIVVIAVGLGGLQLVFLGIIGEYVGRIYEEAKGRPRWVVKAALGLGDEGQPRSAALAGTSERRTAVLGGGS
jgi:dolichol-phosphate mannosyltransferase